MRTRRSPILPSEVCEWKEDEDGNWGTSCGNLYCIIEGMPKENGMKFCCYCGKLLKEIAYKEAL